MAKSNNEMGEALARWEEERKRAAEMTKRTMYRLLRQCRSIAFVHVEYDGYGDSGSIEHLAYLDNKNREVKKSPGQKVDETVERYVLALLPMGWEDGNGARGTIQIDVAKKRASVEHNDRYEDYETSEWEDPP